MDKPLLTARDAATLLAVKPSWIYQAVRSGRLPHLKVGRHIRFREADLDTWLAAFCAAPTGRHVERLLAANDEDPADRPGLVMTTTGKGGRRRDSM